METLLNFLERIKVIQSWSLAAYDPTRVFYPKSKLKIDRKLHLVALFSRDAIYLIRT